MTESALAMAAYFFLNWLHGWPSVPLADSGVIYRKATTMTLAAIVFSQIGAVFACRTERISVFKIGLFTNRIILLGIAVELILLNILIYVPFLHGLFNTAPIGPREWAFLILCTPVMLLVDKVYKMFVRRRENHKK